MVLRGAPLIGICAAYGMVFCVRESNSLEELIKKAQYLSLARPTAVNLNWAIKRILNMIKNVRFDKKRLAQYVLNEARRIHEEDRMLCYKIGRFGSRLIKKNAKIITICNTGSLATGGTGTAFSVIYHSRNKRPFVYVLETRPYLQGARLTMYELKKARIDSCLICDSAAAFVMKREKIDLVITGADRIARNGDTANKIGTFMLASLAKRFRIPFYVAAPYSTFDASIPTGADIPVEARPHNEIIDPIGLKGFDIKTLNIAFDITPASHITAFITDKGIIKSPLKIPSIFNYV
jgi:methylthioribose-1-phosphate isomerase